MTSTLDIAARTAAGPAQLRVTAAAFGLLERLRAEAGEVAVVVAPRLSDDVLCVGLRDLVLGPNDALVATVRGCPVYVDRRHHAAAALPSMVLDVHADALGPTFVLRSSAERSR